MFSFCVAESGAPARPGRVPRPEALSFSRMARSTWSILCRMYLFVEPLHTRHGTMAKNEPVSEEGTLSGLEANR